MDATKEIRGRENNREDKFDYIAESKRLLAEIPYERIAAVWDWEYCELDSEFIGFIDQYATLNIPHDFTIIDIGCCQAVQAYYFKDHRSYIGIDPDVPTMNRLIQDNAAYYEMTAQEFVQNVLSSLVKNGLDLSKSFAICSAVPDVEAQTLVAQTFPYHRVTYPSSVGMDVISCSMPPKTKQQEIER